MTGLTGRSYLTTAEAARLLRVDRKTLLGALERGDVPGLRVGPRVWRVPVADLEGSAPAVAVDPRPHRHQPRYHQETR